VSATPQQVRQWSDDVAANPASLSFLPLARAYREQGRRDAALRLCIRGLERHPDNVEAHHLLGLLYREGGEALKAFDEWDIALALAPEHLPSRREIGFLCAERGDWGPAIRHLEKAAEQDPDDAQARAALETAITRASAPAELPPEPPAAAAAEPRPSPEVGGGWASGASPGGGAAPAPSPAALVETAPAAAPPSAFDAIAATFDALSAERGIVGGVLLDDQGFVLAGRIEVNGTDHGPEIAAVLSGASGEAGRALRHLGLGSWKGILVETPEAVIRLAPAGDGMVAVAARRDVPTGWVLRVAGRAREAALRFLDGGGA
ncbi:MAG TPA: tetratricopeptide repeat protein, partial [Longimicrobium sp.]|nr:tetratricopeptide repeat protein [Longimicrobium sp.]